MAIDLLSQSIDLEYVLIFYHGTDSDTWDKIQEEGFIWGKRPYAKSRVTYLAVDKNEARNYGDVVLKIQYDPTTQGINNYIDGAWQHREYEPILLDWVERIE